MRVLLAVRHDGPAMIKLALTRSLISFGKAALRPDLSRRTAA